MDIGKLPARTLARLLAKTRTDSSVLIGPAYGEDAAAVKFGGKVLVAASDPITFATDRIGYYAVSVNANDIAVIGGTPRYFLATILLPDGCSEHEAEYVFIQVEEECIKLNIILVGGHTEITSAVSHTVVSGCMLGEAEEGSLIKTGGAKEGNSLILVGGIAVEGTAILAREAEEKLSASGVSKDLISSGKALLDNPGICIVEYARVAMSVDGVTAMHDPTEGGLATALREMAEASRLGMQIDRDAIPVLHQCKSICDALEIDPLGLIASGSLLVAISQGSEEKLLKAYSSMNIPAAIIGRITNSENGVVFTDGNPVPIFSRDEIAAYFDKREKQAI